MNISGKAIIFVKEVGKDNPFKIFETTFSHKTADGKYIDNVTARVEFSKDLLPEEKKAAFKAGYAYPMEISGFVTTRGYDDRNCNHRSEIALFVKEAKTTGKPKKISEKKAEPKAKPTKKAKEADVEYTDDGTIVGIDGEPLPL